MLSLTNPAHVLQDTAKERLGTLLRRNEFEDAVTAFASGDHQDPFSFLGMHVDGRTGSRSVRAFLPQALGVVVVDAGSGEKIAELSKVHDSGFFVGAVSGRGEPFDYRLRLITNEGESEIEDPYRFPEILGELDIHLLAEGRHLRSFEKLGAHPIILCGVQGTAFAVWAPNAQRVSVIGDFNAWDGRRHAMRLRHDCGVWEIFLPGVRAGATYKYEIKTQGGDLLRKADPFAFQAEPSPHTASVVHGLLKAGPKDPDWIEKRRLRNDHRGPIAIYEVHRKSVV